MRDEYDFSFAPQGWQCPICKRVYSPTYPWCIFCGNETVTTTDRTTLNINNNDFFEDYLNELEKQEFCYDKAATSTAYKPKPNEKITVQW